MGACAQGFCGVATSVATTSSFLEALHHYAVHNITWRALPAQFGRWNSVYGDRESGVFEAFFEALAAMSETARLV
jgi:hypothetical protein